MRVVVSRKNAFKNNQTTIEEEREGESERAMGSQENN